VEDQVQTKQLLPPKEKRGEDGVASWKPAERYQTLSRQEPGT